MRKFIFIAGLVLFAACNNHTGNNKSKPEDSTDAGVAYDLTPVWTYEYDSVSRQDKAKRLRDLNPEEASEQTLVSILNTEWPEIQVEFKKVSNDTAYVAIPNSTALTQTMGSAGATQYMAVATYTLTEMKGIKYVHFDFTEGDHAEPGTYSREQFEKGF
jgi:hypothetical protein